MRRVFLLSLIHLLALSGASCTRVKQERDDLFTAIYKTESLAREFSYEEKAPSEDRTASRAVTGFISDDYRYHVEGSVDGNPSAGEVVIDDARAFRVSHPEFLDQIASAASGVEGGIPSLELLASGRWVVDSTGANHLFTGGADNDYSVGRDPLLDSLRVLQYSREAAGEAAEVLKFNPESPSYRPKFDPFPHPESNVIRYDLVPPRLVPRDPTVAGASALQLPGVRYFRKMSFYVKDGRVIRILERISVEEALEDTRSNIAARIGDYGITLPSGPLREQAEFLTRELNAGVESLGQPAIRLRDLEVQFRDFGEKQSIELPAGAVPGSLAGLRNTGQILFERVG